MKYNIFKQKALIEKLKETIHFYENILSKLPTNVYWKDRNSIYLGCNDQLAEVLNLASRDAIKGMSDFDFDWVGKATAESFITFDKRVMKTGKSLITEDVVKEATGRLVTLLTNKTPLKDKRGRTVGVLAISVDISERKKMEKNLYEAKMAAEAADEAKSMFIANMSHDIRTPLSGIIGMAELLKEEGGTSKDRQYGHIIHQSGEDLLSLLNDILTIVTIDQMKEEKLDQETFNLFDRIEHLNRLFAINVHMKQITLEINMDPNLPEYIVSDRLKIDRILLNLFSNALKFTEKGYIRLSVNVQSSDHDHAMLQFIISDSGIGIPKNKINQIFDHFYKIASSYDTKYTGYGIGLFIVKHFLTQLNGEIKVESELGKGSTFYVSLPVKVGKKEDAKKIKEVTAQKLILTQPGTNLSSKLSSPAKEKEKGNGLKILLIENDHLSQYTQLFFLESAGLNVTAVTDSTEAIKAVKSQSFDLIITDIGLPNIDGHEFTVLVRYWEKKLNKEPIPIIGLSAHVSSQTKEEALSAGMNIVLEKPISHEKIAMILKRKNYG
jgi:two-component system, OmpR family, aerobic respiration control sensor histidine kinase ArcB